MPIFRGTGRADVISPDGPAATKLNVDGDAIGRGRPGSSADIVRGFAGDDYLDGSGGDDVLSGDGGNDVLRGGAGNDILAGGAGSDWFYGGSGADTFYAEQNDHIVDFGEEDRIIGDYLL